MEFLYPGNKWNVNRMAHNVIKSLLLYTLKIKKVASQFCGRYSRINKQLAVKVAPQATILSKEMLTMKFTPMGRGQEPNSMEHCQLLLKKSLWLNNPHIHDLILSKINDNNKNEIQKK